MIPVGICIEVADWKKTEKLEEKMKKMKPFLVVFVFVVLAMGYSLGQLTYTSARAEEEAGMCCRFSSTCEGTDTCQSPLTWAACCDVTTAGCVGVGYCRKSLAD